MGALGAWRTRAKGVRLFGKGEEADRLSAVPVGEAVYDAGDEAIARGYRTSADGRRYESRLERL